MGVYKASEAKQHEYQGVDTFRLEKSGDRAQVVFLYTDKDSIDGYTCHRLTNAKYYTYTIDCCKAEKGECPACDAGESQSNRIFVKMLDLTNNKVVIWDKPFSYRQTLEGFMHYFTPLYKQKYELTRQGEKLKTTYSPQSIGESGLSEEEYKAYLAKADELIASYVRPADSYEDVKNKVDKSKAESVEPVAAQGATSWNAPQQPVVQQGWGQPVSAPQQTAPNAGWNAQATAPQQTGWSQTPQQPAQPQASATGWGAPAPAQPGAPVQNGWNQAPAPNGEVPF